MPVYSCDIIYTNAAHIMISGLAHVNILVPPGTLEQADQFYGETLGLKPREVPKLQKNSLRWFDIGDSGQQVHVALGMNETKSSRHPCFKIESPDALLQLRQRIWEHFTSGGPAAPQEADRPGDKDSGRCPRPMCCFVLGLTDGAGAQGVEYPSRFFARDYAGNRLEFSL
ncbi:hypothetical protein D0867_08865 [Hortaea werneckii]|uniref:VOC domain-containing protein n=1 Tax=Hortaea werneckii TaxID=91943 RepID=A0A3M7AM95_HORWE|nr:hypothetical protein D0867_08865 [Hortaea werneckii]RMY28581.1 hypothetical protein D0866_09311 [Hortaea werneckii]RMY71045.1 hypothetical protein D0863_05418 [Hortaea werneckii]